MAASSQCCGVCDLRHIPKPSIVWCTECEEGLCTECKEHHSLSKASRNHSVIPIAKYQKLPADVLKISQYCMKHDKKYQFYCKKHEYPCCSTCIVESHKECRDIVELECIIRSAKTSNVLNELEQTLVEVAENLKKIRQHLQLNLSKFKEKRTEIEKEIKKTRTQINNHLDKLQEDFMKQIYVVEEKENSKICQLMPSLEMKEKEVADYQRYIMNIKQHASDLQMFLSMKQIEEDVCSKDKFLQTLVESDGQHSLSYEINTSIQNIMSYIRSFGEVHIESKSFDMVLIKKKNKQAQMMIPILQLRSIETIKLTKQKTINTQGYSIFGCCILPDGRLAFTYYSNKSVKLFSNAGLTDFEVKIPCSTYDIVYISQDNTLAVSSGSSPKQCINILDLETKQITKTISLDSYIDGITLKDNQLIYSAQDKGIKIINLFDNFKRAIVRDELPSECYIATLRDKIYHTNRWKNVITCYNLQGELQWTFHNKRVLKIPYGIDADNDGNVYVVGRDSDNVVLISPDGQRHREVLTASDGLSFPTSLHYSRPNNQLLVTNFKIKKAFLFNCN